MECLGWLGGCLDRTGLGASVGFAASLLAFGLAIMAWSASRRATSAAEQAREAAERAVGRLGKNEALSRLAAVCQTLEDMELQLLVSTDGDFERARMLTARWKLSEIEGLAGFAEPDRAVLVATRAFLVRAMQKGNNQEIISEGLADQSDQLRALRAKLRRKSDVE